MKKKKIDLFSFKGSIQVTTKCHYLESSQYVPSWTQMLRNPPPDCLSVPVSPECASPRLFCNRLLSESRCPDSTSPLRPPWNIHTDTHRQTDQTRPDQTQQCGTDEQRQTEGRLDLGLREQRTLCSSPGKTRKKVHRMLDRQI